MSETKQYKWSKIGSFQKSKFKNEDGSDRFIIKVDKTVTLREGDVLNLFTPKNENCPEYILYDVSRKNQNVE